jgi:hypothetical protein
MMELYIHDVRMIRADPGRIFFGAIWCDLAGFTWASTAGWVEISFGEKIACVY